MDATSNTGECTVGRMDGIWSCNRDVGQLPTSVDD
jgi:hypothetical protein